MKCGHPVKYPTHFFLKCSRYVAIKIELVNNVSLISRITTAVLLYGNTELGVFENKLLERAIAPPRRKILIKIWVN